MWETIFLLAFCLLAGLVALGTVLWALFTEQYKDMDGLLLISTCLLLGTIFFLNLLATVRKPPYRDLLLSLFAKNPRKGKPTKGD